MALDWGTANLPSNRDEFSTSASGVQMGGVVSPGQMGGETCVHQMGSFDAVHRAPGSLKQLWPAESAGQPAVSLKPQRQMGGGVQPSQQMG